MNIKYIIFIESIFTCLIAFYVGKIIFYLTNNKQYLILNYLVWGGFFLSSLLLNLDKFIYAIAIFCISCLLVIGFINKMMALRIYEEYLLWMFFIASVLTMFGVIVSKKMAYTLINKEPYDGLMGEEGPIGNRGEIYYDDTREQQCYSHLINSVENLFRSVKRENEIPFDVKEYQFNNAYLKNIIKKYCTDACYK